MLPRSRNYFEELLRTGRGPMAALNRVQRLQAGAPAAPQEFGGGPRSGASVPTLAKVNGAPVPVPMPTPANQSTVAPRSAGQPALNPEDIATEDLDEARRIKKKADRGEANPEELNRMYEIIQRERLARQLDRTGAARRAEAVTLGTGEAGQIEDFARKQQHRDEMSAKPAARAVGSYERFGSAGGKPLPGVFALAEISPEKAEANRLEGAARRLEAAANAKASRASSGRRASSSIGTGATAQTWTENGQTGELSDAEKDALKRRADELRQKAKDLRSSARATLGVTDEGY